MIFSKEGTWTLRSFESQDYGMVGLEGIRPARSTELDTRLREVKAWPKVTQLVAAQPAQSTVLLTSVACRPPHLSLPLKANAPHHWDEPGGTGHVLVM